MCLSACAESGLKFDSAVANALETGLSACAESGLKWTVQGSSPCCISSLCLRGEWIEIL